jgi:hypothetical protein
MFRDDYAQIRVDCENRRDGDSRPLGRTEQIRFDVDPGRGDHLVGDLGNGSARHIAFPDLEEERASLGAEGGHPGDANWFVPWKDPRQASFEVALIVGVHSPYPG